MPITRPSTAKELSQKAKVDVKRELSASDPFLARSYLGAVISALANRVFEFYLALADAELEGNPATAVRTLVRWANSFAINRLTGAASSGALFVSASSGGSGTLIPAGTAFVSSSGNRYVSSADASLGAVAITISSITQAGGTAIVTTTSAHNLASNAIVTISGATEAGYNLANVAITVLSATTFSYEVDGSTGSPATGSPAGTTLGGVITVNSEEVGVAYDLEGDATLVFESPITGVETSGRVTAEGVTDGVDVESDTGLRARLLSRIQNPVTPYNAANIDAVAKQEAGVTRVFVQASTPAIGQVTVYFMRDGDTSPIPSAGEVANVKTRLLTIKPAHVSDSDLIVAAPTAVATNFVFSAVSPSTATMKAAIEAQLREFFERNTDVGVDVVQEAYSAAIFNTIDPVTGQAVSSFTLSSPSADITVSTGEIATLGTVTFP